MYKAVVEPTELAFAFKRQLQLCALKKGETVVFLTDMGADRGVVSAGLAAAKEMGALAYEIRIADGPDDRHTLSMANPLGEGVVEALKQADLVITFFVGFFAAWQGIVRANGGRILNVLDDATQLIRLQSTPELKKAAIAAGERLRRTSTVRVTSDAGTDFSWKIDHEASIFVHYGAADQPGQMDQWGQGMVAMFPVEGSAAGRVVMQPGDVWILPYARLVQSEIDLDIEHGFIRRISGGLDARIFRHHLDGSRTSDSDLDPYAISHLGWGLNPKARWTDVVEHENKIEFLSASARSFPGNFMFSTGPGNKRRTKGHIDMPMCDCSVFLDGEEIIRRGRIIDAAMIVDPGRSYH